MWALLGKYMLLVHLRLESPVYDRHDRRDFIREICEEIVRVTDDIDEAYL